MESSNPPRCIENQNQKQGLIRCSRADGASEVPGADGVYDTVDLGQRHMAIVCPNIANHVTQQQPAQAHRHQCVRYFPGRAPGRARIVRRKISDLHEVLR